MKIIEEELGSPAEKYFSYISPEPVAAASFGQVPPAMLYIAIFMHQFLGNTLGLGVGVRCDFLFPPKLILWPTIHSRCTRDVPLMV